MTTHYTPTAKVLHWLMALLLFGLLALGLYMHELPLSPEKLQLYSWHKWAGVTAFLLVLVRLGWRLAHRPPAPPEGGSRAARLAARAAHAALYVLMLAMPVSGWLMSSAKGVPTVWFGLLPLPDLLAKNPPLGERLAELHAALAVSLMALVALHVAAALKHHFIDRDEVLSRMLPASRAQRP